MAAIKFNNKPAVYNIRDDVKSQRRPSELNMPIKSGIKPKVILITGASSGFGLVTAVHLAAKGHQVIATIRDMGKQTVLLNELNHKKVDTKIDIIRLDVTDKKNIEEVKKHIALKYGYLDVLINNAGYGMSGFFEDLSEEDIREQMETNFYGTQNVTRAVIPFMRPRRKGRIINISSISGLTAYPCFSAYNASKWAVEAWSESLYYELKLFGIDVVLVEPGSYPTNIFYSNARFAKNFDNPDSPYYKISQNMRKMVQENINRNKRDPFEIAEFIEHLINSKNPSFRNIPDMQSFLLVVLRRILPFSIFSTLVYWGAFHSIKK